MALRRKFFAPRHGHPYWYSHLYGPMAVALCYIQLTFGGGLEPSGMMALLVLQIGLVLLVSKYLPELAVSPSIQRADNRSSVADKFEGCLIKRLYHSTFPRQPFC